VVAPRRRRFVWLALILATYAKTDPGWSFSGVGAPIANKGGVAGAWLADLLLYLFGASAWWWVVAGVVLVVAGYRRIGHPELETDHRSRLASWASPRAALERRAGRAASLQPAVDAAAGPGGVLGEIIGRGLSRLLGFNGATLLLLALFARARSLFFGLSWLKVMERIGSALERLVVGVRRRADERRDRELGAKALAVREAVVQAKHEVVDHEPVLVVPQVLDLPKSDRVVKEKQRPLFFDMPDSPLPPLALLDDAPSAQEW
jgi:S-DNA-T family DNA segregation ATPase FtsK/SpoIIIE